MTKPYPGIKIPFLQEEQYPVVDGTRCVEVRIPDDDAFLPVLAGLIKLATKAFNYERIDLARARQIAQMWLVAYLETAWSGCMNCEELQACLAPMFEAQNAIIQQMLNTMKYGDNVQPGVPMTEEQRDTDLAAGTNTSCDLDITWAQCVQIIDYQNTLITDALEIAETATNDTEMVESIMQLPGLQELPINALFGYASMLQDGISENYEAQFTTEYAEEAACAIFCEAKESCEISAQMIYDVFYTRVTDYFGSPITAITTISDLMGYLLDQDIDGAIIADVLMLVVSGGGVLAQLFLGDVGTKKLETVLHLAADDPSSDWEILCTECSTCLTQYDYENQGDFNPLGDNAATLDPTGWWLSGSYSGGGGNPQWVIIDSPDDLTGITMAKLRVDISENDTLNMAFRIDTGSGITSQPPTGFTDAGGVRTYYYDFITPTNLTALGFNVNSAVDIAFRVISGTVCD